MMRVNWIGSILLCAKSVKSSESKVFLLLQFVLFLDFFGILLRYQPQIVDRVLVFIGVLILLNFILMFRSKESYFFAYNNAFFISLWVFTIITILEQLLLLLISPLLLSKKIIHIWAIYFFCYSIFTYVWGIMMSVNVLSYFMHISKRSLQ